MKNFASVAIGLVMGLSTLFADAATACASERKSVTYDWSTMADGDPVLVGDKVWTFSRQSDGWIIARERDPKDGAASKEVYFKSSDVVPSIKDKALGNWSLGGPVHNKFFRLRYAHGETVEVADDRTGILKIVFANQVAEFEEAESKTKILVKTSDLFWSTQSYHGYAVDQAVLALNPATRGSRRGKIVHLYVSGYSDVLFDGDDKSTGVCISRLSPFVAAPAGISE